MLKRIILVILCCPFMSAVAQTDTWLSEGGRQNLRNIYCYQAIEADACTAFELQYLQAYQLFLNYQASEKDELADKFNIALDRFMNIDDTSYTMQCMKVNLLIQATLIYWNREEFTYGARSFYKGYRIFKSIKNKGDEHLKLEALFNVFLAQIPEQYQFLSSILGIEGDELDGFAQLENYTRSIKDTPGLFEEGMVLYGYCQLKFGAPSEYNVLKIMEVSKEHESPIFAFVASSLALKLRLGEEAYHLCNSLPNSLYQQFPLLYYQKGRILLNKLDEQTLEAFSQFNALYGGNSFKADVRMRQAWWYHANANISARDSVIDLAKQILYFPTSNDKQAKNELQTLKEYPKELLKVRLLFDGGNNHQALSTLDAIKKDALTNYYRAEYYYRYARVNQALNKPNIAIDAYWQVIILCNDDDRYIGPYAALKAAALSKGKGEIGTANKLIDIAEELNTGQYKGDIKLKIAKLRKQMSD